MNIKIFGFFIFLFLITSTMSGFGYETISKNSAKVIDRYSATYNGSNCWSMFRYDSNNSGFSPSTAPDTNNVLWIYDSKIIWNFVSSPVVSGGKVYFNGEGDDTVYCVNSENGEEIWNRTLNSDLQASSPSVSDGKVYVVSASNRIYCLDSDDGTEIWNFTTDHYIYTTSPKIYDGRIYVSDNWEVYCIDGNNGSLYWKEEAGAQAPNSVPAVAYGNVYVSTRGLGGDANGKLLCFDADDGQLKWYYNTSEHMYENWDHVTSPAVANNKVYICVYLSVFNDAYIYCFDAETGNKTILYAHPQKYFLLSTPSIAYGNIYFTTSEYQDCYGNLFCIDAETGNVKWESPQIIINNEMWDHGNFLVVADNKVIFHDVCYFHCVDYYTGDLIWYKIPSELGWYSQMWGEPAVVNGTIYAAYGNKVCAFNDNVSVTSPYCPSPEDGTVNFNVDTVLSWKGGDPDEGDSVRYLIFFGEDQDDLLHIYDEIGPCPWNQTDISWDPGILEHDTTYYWKIVPIDEQGSSKTGPVWRFTTNYAPNIPIITGPAGGKAGLEYNYTFFATDPTGDDICYYVDWSDSTTTGWTDFVASGTEITLTHTWFESGTYIIKVKAKDVYGAESNWGTLQVSMPRNYMSENSLLFKFMEKFLQAFPLLRHLMGI